MGGEVGVGNDKLRGAVRLVAGAVVLSGEGLVAKRELKPVVGGLQSGLLKRLLKLRLLVLQQFQRIGAIGGHVCRHLAVLIHVQPHVDAAQFGRIETDIELVGTALRAGGNRDREAGNGHRRCIGSAAG